MAMGDDIGNRERTIRLVEMSLDAAVRNNEGQLMPPSRVIEEADQYLKWATEAYTDLFGNYPSTSGIDKRTQERR